VANAPQGYAKVDANHHLWSRSLIGQGQADGQFKVVAQSEQPIQPNPFPRATCNPSTAAARRVDDAAREERSMSATDIFNITLMQGFAGLSLFSVLLLMGLGLAVIFGQMGVINMAHGEFMTIGAYTIYLFSWFSQNVWHALTPVYFFFAILAAFALAFAAGWLAEWALIRHLYKRPLDTLLATWGLSLGMQQVFRSTFGPKEVSPALPDWLMGSWEPTPGLDIPVNGMFVMGLALLMTGGLLLALYRSRWGLRVRATVRTGRWRTRRASTRGAPTA
jgi:ABC-type branched-subunit amino acid transport system permease subunit